MTVRNYIQAIPMKSLATTALVSSTTWYVVDAAGLPQPCALIRITNASDVDVQISFDGSTAADYVPYNEVVELPLQDNAIANPGAVALLKKGTKIYIKGDIRGAKGGTIYIAGYFQN